MKNNKKIAVAKNTWSGGKVFFLAFLLALVLFLPNMIKDNGNFFYYGDYMAQQIPFYTLAHEAVRNGEFFINWTTDLGSSLYTSYSFYLLGSPFFWITIPFPKEMLPQLMGVLLALKIALSVVFSYFYIRRYTQRDISDVIGGFLYGMSGYVITSVVFNHFLDVIVFFPLFVIALDDCIEKKRKGAFALITALCAIVNYYFFIGEVLFLMIYVIAKYLMFPNGKKWIEKLKQMLPALLEGVIGVLLSGFFLLPSLLAVSSNHRVSQVISGKGIFIYENLKTYGAILKSMFLPADFIALPTVFSNYDLSVSSVALFLPLFSLSGVIAFFYMTRKKGSVKAGEQIYYIKPLLILCFVVALIPGLNALFSGANASYYARWFFMPILWMALATVIAIERFDGKAFFVGVMSCLVAGGCFVGIYFISQYASGTIGRILEVQNRAIYVKQLLIFAVSMMILIYLIFILKKDQQQQYLKVFFVATIICCFFSSYVYIRAGRQKTSEEAIAGVQKQVLKGETFEFQKKKEFARVDMKGSYENATMIWKIPSVASFISTISGSAFDFYDFVGIERKMRTTIPETSIGVRSLLSVKYYLLDDSEMPLTNQKVYEPLSGFSLSEKTNGYHVYENKNALHMGVTFSYYMKNSEYETLSKKQKDRVLVYALIVADDEIPKTDGILPLTAKDFIEYEKTKGFSKQVNELNNTTSTKMKATDTKISFHVKSKKDGWFFLSVPYSSGYKAKINGKKTAIQKVDGGLMAVKVKQGTSKIVLTYEEPGLKVGCICSLIGIIGLVVYKKKKNQQFHR